MTEKEQNVTLSAMSIYGGGFAHKLSTAWSHADEDSSAQLGRSFPELVEQYGPGSVFYAAASHESQGVL